jgi:hypothetical protein
MIAPKSALLPELTHHEKLYILTAAFYAPQLHPGPMGELVVRELQAYANFGYRLGHDTVMVQLVEQMHQEWTKREGKVA